MLSKKTIFLFLQTPLCLFARTSKSTRGSAYFSLSPRILIKVIKSPIGPSFFLCERRKFFGNICTFEASVQIRLHLSCPWVLSSFPPDSGCLGAGHFPPPKVTYSRISWDAPSWTGSPLATVLTVLQATLLSPGIPLPLSLKKLTCLKHNKHTRSAQSINACLDELS